MRKISLPTLTAALLAAGAPAFWARHFGQPFWRLVRWLAPWAMSQIMAVASACLLMLVTRSSAYGWAQSVPLEESVRRLGAASPCRAQTAVYWGQQAT